MKRLNNLYKNICNIDNIISCYNEVRRNTKSKSRVENLRAYKNIYISRVYKIINDKNYQVGKSVEFIIREPKERKIVSLNLQDKIVNHLVARHILYPAILPCLLDINVASRKNLGTIKGLEYANNFRRICEIKYETYYILKGDVSKFFSSIDHTKKF